MSDNTFSIKPASGNYVVLEGWQEEFLLEKRNYAGLTTPVTEKYAWYVHPIEVGIAPQKAPDKSPNQNLVHTFAGKIGKYEIGCSLESGKIVGPIIIQVIEAKFKDKLIGLPIGDAVFKVNGDIKLAYKLLTLWNSGACELAKNESPKKPSSAEIKKYLRGIDKLVRTATENQADKAIGNVYTVVAQLELEDNISPDKLDLRVFALRNEKGVWSIVDWSSFGDLGTSSVFKSETNLRGSDSLLSALENWIKSSKYPPGIVRFSTVVFDDGMKREQSGIFPSPTKKSYAKNDEKLKEELREKVNLIKKFSDELNGLDDWLIGCQHILSFVGGSSGSAKSDGYIQTSHTATLPRSRAKISTTDHQAIYLALSILGTSYKTKSSDKIEWKRGGQIIGATPESPNEARRFIGHIEKNSGAEGILCQEQFADTIENLFLTKDPFERIKKTVEAIAKEIKANKVIYLDVAWTSQNSKFLSELQAVDNKGFINNTDIQLATTNQAKHATKIQLISDKFKITRHYPFDPISGIGKKINLTFDRFTIKGLIHSKYPASAEPMSSLLGIEQSAEFEDIPDTRHLYVFQSGSESTAKLLHPLPPFNPNRRTIEVDTDIDLIAFISPIELDAERLDFYSSNRDHLISRGCWVTSAVLNSYANNSTIHLEDHDHSIKELLNDLDTLDKKGELLNQSKRIRIAHFADVIKGANPKFSDNLSDDFPELIQFRKDWIAECSLIEKTRSFMFDLLFDLKRNTQWALHTEDLFKVFKKEEHENVFEYLGLMTHDNEFEYLLCQDIMDSEIDPLGTTRNISNDLKLAKAGVGFAKSSKTHTYLRHQTIKRMLDGILPFEMNNEIIDKRRCSFPLASRRDIIKMFNLLDFKVTSNKFIENLEKILSESKDLEMLFDKNRKARIISSIMLTSTKMPDGSESSPTVSQSLSAAGAQGNSRKIRTRMGSNKLAIEVIDEVTADEKLKKIYATLKASEPVLLHVGLAIDLANLYLSAAKARQAFNANQLSAKDATTVTADFLSAAKGGFALTAFMAKNSTSLVEAAGPVAAKQITNGLKAAEKSVGVLAAIASVGKSAFGLYDAAKKDDDQIYYYNVSEFSVAIVGVSVALADIATLAGTATAARFGGLGGIPGVIIMCALQTGLYFLKDATEDSLKNWPKKTKKIFEENFTRFDCTLITSTTNNSPSPLKKFYLPETPDDIKVLDEELTHLARLFTQAEFSITHYYSNKGIDEISFEISACGFLESTKILFGSFSAETTWLERSVSETLGISTPSCQDGNPDTVELHPSDFENGSFSRKLKGEWGASSYIYTMQVDLFGDGKFLIPSEAAATSGEVILKNLTEIPTGRTNV